MTQFDEVMQQLVNLPYEGLMNIATDALNKVYPVCKKIDPKNDGYSALVALLLAAIGADRKLSALEAKFVSELTGLTSENVDKMITLYVGTEEDLIDKFHDTMDADTKSAIFQLVACICACDETICREESAYLKRLLA